MFARRFTAINQRSFLELRNVHVKFVCLPVCIQLMLPLMVDECDLRGTSCILDANLFVKLDCLICRGQIEWFGNMQRAPVTIEEQLILKAIKEECPWENLPKRLQATLNSKEEWHRRLDLVASYLLWRFRVWIMQISEVWGLNSCLGGWKLELILALLNCGLLVFYFHSSSFAPFDLLFFFFPFFTI